MTISLLRYLAVSSQDGRAAVSSAALAGIAEAAGFLRHAQRAVPTGGVDWEAVYAANVEPVYRFVYSRTGNRPDAEDVTSQVFLQAMPFLRSAGPAETRAYLFATARTELAKYWRHRYGIAVDSMDGFAAPAAEDLVSSVAARRIECLLAHLPERYRRVLELRFLRGFTVRETATEMSVSAGNARVMQVRALRTAAALGRDTSLCQG